MSVAAIAWALRTQRVQNPAHKLVLIALADHADNDGKYAWPAQKTIAEYACCSERSVRRYLQSLEDDGVIMRGDQRAVEHIREDHRPVVWDLAMADGEAPRGDRLSGRSDCPAGQMRQDGGTDTTERGDSCDTTAGHCCPTNRPRTIPETVLERESARARATRLPDDWQPDDELTDWARRSCPDVDLAYELDNFRDYWHSAPPNRSTKKDWRRTYQKWMRTAQHTEQLRGRRRTNGRVETTHRNEYGELWVE